ncbi:MAG: L-2-hydroxyglutarate oxidase [Acidimicrobiales bacterium]
MTERADRYDYAIIGGGILGLATAMTLARQRGPSSGGAGIVVLEKEPDWAQHQTGRNSGVIHAGVYYKPGSLKATMCQAGSASIVAFAQEHDIDYEVCGKLIVATEDSQLDGLRALHQRALENGLPVELIGAEESAEIEPHVRSVGAIKSPTTGIIDYVAVCRAYARLAADAGAELRHGVEVTDLTRDGTDQILSTTDGEVRARFVVSCAGLQSDRIARLQGADPGARIVPFRGEYYELVPDRRHLVKHLVYPVPNPDFPFLGVHFTRMISGEVHAGPNAVLAFKREGYRKRDISARDLVDVLGYRGFWHLARAHWRDGMAEMVRSFSKAQFTKSLQELVPEVTADDLVPSEAGVRAQALKPDGGLVDDFLIVEEEGALHVCNAPSPAATASLEIAQRVVQRIVEADSTAAQPGR